MYSTLSKNQRKILEYDNGTVVVKACPGSGKTYSVAARISKLLSEKDFSKKGIAAISFTNIACVEIEDKLKNDFNTYIPLTYPHFLGTIDSFINSYIFLPFGHLIMDCKERPELVGEPHSSWSVKKFKNDPDQYFDKTTFNIENHLIQIAPSELFKNVTWKNYYSQDGTINGNIQNIINSKYKYFKLGYANQSDANYIALKVLEKYHLIAKNIANRFEYFIIDESQDTNNIQMKIIEILNKSGAKNIMLIGDRDQSIFEWNNANPELFDEKYKIWDKIVLNENRRSSKNICNFITNLSSFDKITAVTKEVKNNNNKPEIKGYSIPKTSTKKDSSVITFEESKASFQIILDEYLKKCKEDNIQITKDNVAVLYRGKVNSEYLDLKKNNYNSEKLPWVEKEYFVKSIIKGKHFYDNGEFLKGYKLIEKGYWELLEKYLFKPDEESNHKDFYCSNLYIKNKIEKYGLKKYRKYIFKFIEILPKTNNKTIIEWIKEANEKISLLKNKNTTSLSNKLNINNENSNVLIDDFFGGNLNNENLHPFYFGTVHSVKGKTFDAVLLLLGKKAVKNYENIVNEEKSKLNPKDLEELRIVYVGISRPKRILYMAVPNNDLILWQTKMAII